MCVDELIQQIMRICQKYSAETVWLYGSRAKGTCLERSDIDIAVAGVYDFDSLSEEVEELETLYTIDLLNLDTCRNEFLLEDIQLYGQKIYEKVL